MAINEKELLDLIEQATNEKVFEASDTLGAIGSVDTQHELIKLLKHENPEVIFLASRTLGLMEENEAALEPLFAAINDNNNETIAGDLMMALEGFDVSEQFVPIFKLYLFGSFKVSKIAKELLDYEEFDITQRVLKKANKHWNHYKNNIKHDDAFKLVEQEVMEMFGDLEDFLNDSN